MPFYSAGPSLVDTVPTTTVVTIVPYILLSSQLQQGTIQLTVPTIIPIQALSDQVSSGVQTTVLQSSLVPTTTTNSTTNSTMNSTGNSNTNETVNGVTIINETSTTDPIYTLILNAFQALSDPANMEANNYSTTVLPILDQLDAEIAQYPDISLIISQVQSTFQRITGILSGMVPSVGVNYIEQYVNPQLTQLDNLISKIPTS